jgi:hypothetical protein
LEGEGDVPTYQDFSLFSAFSSDRFGGILDSAPDHVLSDDARHHDNSDAEFSKLDGVTSLLAPLEHVRVSPRQQSASGELLEGQGPNATQFSALLAQNARLESALQETQQHMSSMSQAMDRLNYEHSIIVQQLQQSWQFMHMQLYGQGGPAGPHAPVAAAGARGGVRGGGSKHADKHLQGEAAPQSEAVLQCPAGGSEGGGGEEVAEEIRRLKERLCTMEGRHKMVQGKVSQLDKLYGASSASWGRRIRIILQGEGQEQGLGVDSAKQDDIGGGSRGCESEGEGLVCVGGIRSGSVSSSHHCRRVGNTQRTCAERIAGDEAYDKEPDSVADDDGGVVDDSAS